MECDASTLKQRGPPQSVMSTDSTGQVLFAAGKKVGDNHILVGKILAIREAIMTIIRKQVRKVIIRSNSLVAIKVITGENNPHSHITNLVENIEILTRIV